METWKAFAQQDLTHSMVHYLLAIRDLRQELGYARVTDVAERLVLTKGTVSTGVKALKKRRLVVEDRNRFLSLSDRGEQIVQQVGQTFHILEYLFARILGVEPEKAREDACKIEHLLSPESTERLLALIQALRSDSRAAKLFLHEFQKHGTHSPSSEECPFCQTEGRVPTQQESK